MEPSKKEIHDVAMKSALVYLKFVAKATDEPFNYQDLKEKLIFDLTMILGKAPDSVDVEGKTSFTSITVSYPNSNQTIKITNGKVDKK